MISHDFSYLGLTWDVLLFIFITTIMVTFPVFAQTPGLAQIFEWPQKDIWPAKAEKQTMKQRIGADQFIQFSIC